MSLERKVNKPGRVRRMLQAWLTNYIAFGFMKEENLPLILVCKRKNASAL